MAEYSVEFDAVVMHDASFNDNYVQLDNISLYMCAIGVAQA